MQVFQTSGVPPRRGSIILPTSGCTMNSSVALRKSVRANRSKTPTVLLEKEDGKALPPLGPIEGAYSCGLMLILKGRGERGKGKCEAVRKSFTSPQREQGLPTSLARAVGWSV